MDTNKSKGVVDRKIENATTKKQNLPAGEEKREKKLSSAQKALPVLIVLSVTLGIILIATLIAFFQLKKDDEQNSNTLEAVYASSYFTMVDGINNLQVDSAKFETLENVSSQRKSLKDMEQDCGYVLSGLSILPIEAESNMSATKFFNQIDGMCEAYINKLDKGESLTTNEIAMVTEMSFILGQIKEQFNTHNSMVNKVGYSFIDASIFNSKGINEFSNSLGSLNSEAIDYPTMIFDGPFSASLEDKSVRGLAETEVGREEVETYIRDNVFYGTDKIKLSYKGETDGDFVTYDYEVKANDVVYDVQVTKREGKLLTLNGYLEKRDAVLSKEKAIEMAEKFTTRLGYEDMKAVWYEAKENVAYINLAPIIKGVILYPDLAKVKVDLGSQVILGFEGQNYCFNHRVRDMSKTLTKLEAEKAITGDFEIINTNLALIPQDNGGEQVCYEIVCEGLDGIYYFYVNADNGNIEDNLKLVEQDGVEVLI